MAKKVILGVDKVIGDVLRLSRLEKKLTLEDVAKSVGVSINYISKIEKNENSNPSDEIIIKLAKKLGLDENFLFRAFGKLPLSTRVVLRNNPTLADQIAKISSNSDLDEKSREMFLKKVVYWYEKLSEESDN